MKYSELEPLPVPVRELESKGAGVTEPGDNSHGANIQGDNSRVQSCMPRYADSLSVVEYGADVFFLRERCHSM